MNFGFIKLHRKIKEWDWIDEPKTLCLFVHLLLNANFENKKWRGINIKRGQFLTSLPKLKEISGLSIQQTRTALDKLKSTHDITVQSTKTYSLITLTNYSFYQENKIDTNTQINTQSNSLSTDEQQTSNRRATSTKERKEIKESEEIKEVIRIPNFLDQILFDEFLQQRKKDKNPLEGMALKLTIEDLENWEYEKEGSANMALRNAIKGKWKSIIKPSESKFNFNNNNSRIGF